MIYICVINLPLSNTHLLPGQVVNLIIWKGKYKEQNSGKCEQSSYITAQFLEQKKNYFVNNWSFIHK